MTQELLHSILDYNPHTGIFTWKDTRHNKVKIGDVASASHPSGYMYVRLNGKNYSQHRMAWLYMYGELPEYLDHINHTRDDNRISNLREATKQDNARNRTIPDNHKHGAFGISFEKDRMKWTARITHDGERKRVGRYNTKEEAIKARKEAETKYGYHKNHGTTR